MPFPPFPLPATTIFAGMTGVAGAALFGSIFGVAGKHV